MADYRIKATVDTSQAERSLSNLQKTVSNINDTFVKLRTTLATISLGATINQALQFADAVGDLSDATGIAIGNILGFQSAVAASGGSVEGAQKALLKLVNSIGEAADGSISVQQAFRSVGVSLDDLRTLSEQDILAKTLEGLDKLEDRGRRSILITQLLGKEFRNVAPGQLAQAYAQATAESSKYADAIKNGAAAQQNIDKTLTEFKIGLLDAIKPLTDLIRQVNIGVEGFKKFVQAILAVGAVFVTWTIIGRVWKVLTALYAVIVELVSAAGGLGQLFANLVRGFGAIWRATDGAGGALYRMWLAVKAVGVAIAETLAPAVTALKPIVLPVLASIAAAWGWIQDSTEGAINKLRDYASALTFGLVSPSGAGGGRGDGQAELEQRKRDAEEAAKKEKELREVLDRQAQTRSKINIELKQNIDNMAIGLSRQIEGILLEAKLIELSKLRNVISEDEVEIIKAQSQADVERLAAVKKLQQENERLRGSLKYAKDEEKDGILAQIAANDQLIKKTNEYYKGHNENLRSAITNLQTARLLEAARLQDMENMKKAIEDQISRQQQLGETLRDINNRRVEMRFETSLKGLSPLRQQIARINREARNAAMEAGRAFTAQFESEDGLTPERAQEMADGLASIAKGFKSLADEQIRALGVSEQYLTGFSDTSNENLKRILEFQEEFKYGIKDAFENYRDSALDAAQQARDGFQTFTRGMEDAFVQFALTGKLSFKEMANSILADLARIAVKRAIVFFGSKLFGIPGLAEGGPVDARSPYIVGERGPELFVPTTAGKIIPNHAMSSGGGGGATLGNTTVVYNISAVDAPSFRALVARDPQFIFNVTEAGRRSQPTRRLA